MKYRILTAVGPVAYCDPDEYPVARAGAAHANAVSNYPSIRDSGEEYRAILSHLNLVEPLSDDQKVAVYTQWKLLNALQLNGASPALFDQTFRMGSGSTTDEVAGSISAEGAVHVDSRRPGRLNCPICLVAGTIIDTPAGARPVTALRVGMTVWSMNADGRRVVSTIVQTGRMRAPVGHVVLRVTLADGRSVTASPGHPTGDDRLFAQLEDGDVLAGSRIVSILPLPYGGYTYDLLPDSATGDYWANGILVGSTLFRPLP